MVIAEVLGELPQRLIVGGADIFQPGLGKDTLDYSARSATISVYLNNDAADDGENLEGDNADEPAGDSMENVLGGSGQNALVGNPLDNTLIGKAGPDTLVGNSGADRLTGGSGIDIFDGGLPTPDTVGSILSDYCIDWVAGESITSCLPGAAP